MGKRILHKFRLNEISAVDRMAQEGAKMVLMKRDDSEDIAKGAFIDAVAAMEAREVVRELWHDLWESEDAMYDAIQMIVNNPERYPDVQSSIIEALDEYSAKVQEQAAEAAAAVPSEGDGVSSDPNDPTMKSDHPEGDNDNPLNPKEDPMSKTTEPTVESLTVELTAAQGKLAKSEAYGKLNDAEKSYYDNLPDSERDEFLKFDGDHRAQVLKKAAAEDPVIYTSEDGEEFHKSDDPRLVKMAKRADADRKQAREDRERAENMEFAKRAEDELGHLTGGEDAKVSLLKAINGIKDEDVRKEISQMLKAADDAASPAFDTRGTTDVAKGDAEEQLNDLAKAYSEKHDMPFAKAYNEVLKTDEGSRLYTETQKS